MGVSVETIRGCLLYEFKLGSSAADTTRRICLAFGAGAVRERTAQNWFRRFRDGDTSLQDKSRSGPPVHLDDEALQFAVEQDSGQTCQELARTFGVSGETVRRHLHALGKTYRLSRWVPHRLSAANKQQRVSACLALLSRHDREPFLDRVLTCDEKWIQYSTPKRSRHWLSAGDAVPHTSRPPLHPRKVLLCVWWTARGIVHHEHLPRGQTITAAVYSQQLGRVQLGLERREPALVNRKGVLLLQDNARPHTAVLTRNTIRELGWEVLCHPPYSPDIAPSDYHLFRSLDNHVRGTDFTSFEELSAAVQDFFSSKDEAFYRRGIYELLTRWQQVVVAQGDYFDE